MGEVIAQFNKNSSEEVRITLEEFKGHRLFDIRSYYYNGQDWLPTKKGLSLKVELSPEFKRAVEELERALEEKGGKDGQWGQAKDRKKA